MLRIIEGGAKTGKSTRVREELLKAAEQEEAEGRLLLLVPEQFSFETEREYLDALGLARAGRVRVASFARFAADLFREFGGMAGDYADDAARLTAMKLALQQCRGQLSAYGPLAGRPDFPQQMVGQVAEFKNAGLTGADLELAEAGVGDGPLREKLSDLSLLWSLYEGILGEHYIDGLDSLSRAAMLCAEHRWFAGRKIWLDGFKSFTAVQERLIGLMLAQKAEVTVTLPIGGEDSRFFVPRETAKRLRALARKAGEQAASPIRLDRTALPRRSCAISPKRYSAPTPAPLRGKTAPSSAPPSSTNSTRRSLRRPASSPTRGKRGTPLRRSRCWSATCQNTAPCSRRPLTATTSPFTWTGWRASTSSPSSAL